MLSRGLRELVALEGPFTFLARPGAWFWIAVGVGSVARLFLLVATEGTYDVAIWQAHAEGIREVGLISYYRHGYTFNHPPPISLLVAGLHAAAAALGLPFALLLRAPFALLDAATTALLAALLRGQRARWLIAAGYWLHPLAWIYSSFHGNTDSGVAFFVLLALLCATRGRAGWAGVAMGVSWWLKLPSVLAAPALFFALPGARQRIRFAAAAVAVGAGPYIPVLLREPAAMIESVLLHGGRIVQTTGGVRVWGISNLYELLPGQLPLEVLSLHKRWNTPICVLPVVLYGWMRRRHADVRGLGTTLALSYAIFHGLTLYWSFQYFAWALPLWLLAGPAFALAASAFAGGYIYALYAFVCGSPLLLGAWDFMGHPDWPLGLRLLRDAATLFFFATGIGALVAAVREEGRAR